MSEEGKVVDHHHYGTFQGVPLPSSSPSPSSYPPVVGFPHPAPPPGSLDPPSQYYARAYQAVPGYVVAEGTPMREPRLPCCGIGFGWFLFIIGFFLAGIPWYVGAFMICCCRRTMDLREKPGYVACSIASVIAIIAIIFGVSRIDG